MINIRVRRNTDHIVISTKLLADRRLSWEATGMLAYLLTLPDKWECNVAHLTAERDAGQDKVRRVLGELEEAGYLQRRRLRINGVTKWHSVLVDDPNLDGFAEALGSTKKEHERQDLPGALFRAAAAQNLDDPNVGMMKLLMRAGVSAKRCILLLKLAHVDLPYVMAHVLAFQASGDPVSLLVHRLTYGEPAPYPPAPG